MVDPREAVLEAAPAISREQSLAPDWLTDDVGRTAILPHRRDETAPLSSSLRISW